MHLLVKLFDINNFCTHSIIISLVLYVAVLIKLHMPILTLTEFDNFAHIQLMLLKHAHLCIICMCTCKHIQ